MTTPLKVLLVLLAWAGYSYIAYQWLLQDCCGVSGDESALSDATGADTLQSFKRYPIDFEWNNATPFQNEGFDNRLSSITNDQKEDNILEITGFYYEDEPAPEGFPNMGFARASALKALIAPDLPDDRVELKARLRTPKANEDPKKGYFEGFSYEWKDAEEEEVIATVETVDTTTMETIIRFAFGSTSGEYTQDVKDFLKTLADRIKVSKEKVSLTGHTDNIDTPEFNQNLGQQRANDVKALLIEYGVAEDQIVAESRGLTQPVADNSTERGRSENRRVEVKIIK